MLAWSTVAQTLRNPTYHPLAWPFIIYVAAFNATSSLLNSILEPHGYTEDAAGIDGAILIFSGIASAAISSPILDRRPRWRIPTMKVCVILIAAMYLALVFVPDTGTLPGPYFVSAVIGSASFIIVPLALEMIVTTCHPIGEEHSCTASWAVSQLAGSIFIIVMDALRNVETGNMKKELIFQAVLAWVVLPLPLLLRHLGTGIMLR